MDITTETWITGALLPSYLNDTLEFSTVRYMDTILLVGKRVHIYDITNEAWVEMEEQPAINPKNVVLDVTAVFP